MDWKRVDKAYGPNGNTDIFLLVKAGNIDRTIRVGPNKNNYKRNFCSVYHSVFDGYDHILERDVITVWATISPDWTVQIGQPVRPYCRVMNMWSFQFHGSPSLHTFFWLFLSWKVVWGWRGKIIRYSGIS